MFAPHDLLEIESPECLEDITRAPLWVKSSLAIAPYVVVRRQAHSPKAIAIGVRGNKREQRWPGFVHPDRVKAVVSPFQLRGGAVKQARLEAIPALRHLHELERVWSQVSHKWGPGGSVGFELASGYPAATPASDLDIVLFAPTPFDHEYALMLLLSAQEIAKSIDIIVEAPECAFSLREYATSGGAAILLRCLDEPRMGIDPWLIKGGAELKHQIASSCPSK